MPQTPLLGQLMAFAGNFAPRGYALCAGQLLPISQNTALFSILGTTYGGNGTTNFALPDLRGRTPIHSGQGPGLSSRVLGEQDGAEAVTLTQATFPTHTHALNADAAAATSSSPMGGLTAEAAGSGRGGVKFAVNLYSPLAATTTLAPPQLAQGPGGGQPHNNLQPYLAINWCIALQGIFPARN
jgi:microcystin-dependent protein